jgi:cyanate lyase
MTDVLLKPDRAAVAMRWNRIEMNGLARAIGYDEWYTSRLLTGKEPLDEDDMRKLMSALGLHEIAWAIGLTDKMPEWLREARYERD